MFPGIILSAFGISVFGLMSTIVMILVFENGLLVGYTESWAMQQLEKGTIKRSCCN